MLMLSFVLVSVLISGLFADVEDDLEKCRDIVDVDILEHLETRSIEQELATDCPMLQEVFDCLEDLLKKHTGFTAAEFLEEVPDPDIKIVVTLFLNIRSIINDVCTDGSDLNTAYKEHGICLNSIILNEESCADGAEAAYKAYKGIENSLEEETDEDLNECLMTAYMSACIASQIHEKCGRGAFELYQQVVKRLNVFRLGLCSEEELVSLKTDFLNSLDLEGNHHDLFRVAFDLRKRRK